MGQSGEQDEIIRVLDSSLQVLAKEQGWSSRWIINDCFIAWVEGETNVQVSPDIFVLDYPPASGERMPKRWETWRPGIAPPRFAVEIVSSDWKKDYEINPPRYDHLGVTELVLVDADAFVRDLSARGRAPFSVYLRSSSDRLEQVYRGDGPAFCTELGAYLCFRYSAAGRPEARISLEAEGTVIVPTQGEKLDAQAEKLDAQAEELAALRTRLQKLEGS